jgi:aryl-alcohol dehydrogenase-like predicted oxidoreductase
VADRREDPALATAFSAAEELRALARELETTPAALAIAFALANDNVASVLFGATTPEQVAENATALDVLARLGDEGRARLRAVGR